MEIKLKLNGRAITALVEADTVLLDFLRENGCLSVKRGCDTSNCGLCTVLMDGKPILSCSTLAVRADGHEIQTLEGLQEEASRFCRIHCRPGCRPVWLLQSRICHEHHRFAAGKPGPDR